MSKTVLISQRVVSSKSSDETRDALDIRWVALAERAGLCLVPVPSLSNPQLYFDNISIHGIIFSGGNDPSSVVPNEQNLLRDKIEEQLLRLGAASNLPMLGVCRGMQFLATQLGAKIVKVPSHVAVRHPISLNKNSRNVQNFEFPIDVNSYHNYGVEQLPQELLVVAQSADGVIEAWEHQERRMLGIMWHPERESDLENSAKFLRSFFNV